MLVRLRKKTTAVAGIATVRGGGTVVAYDWRPGHQPGSARGEGGAHTGKGGVLRARAREEGRWRPAARKRGRKVLEKDGGKYIYEVVDWISLDCVGH